MSIVLSLAVLGTEGCDGLLDVTLPGNVLESSLEHAGTAQIQAVSAEGQFYCFLKHYVVGAAMFTDENAISTSQLGHADTYNRRPNSADLRNCPYTGDTDPAMYATAYSALGLTRDVLVRLKDWTDQEVPERTEHLARTAAFSAYTMTLLGEGYCASVIEANGPMLGHTEVFQAAEARFSEALDYARSAGLSDFENLALVGRARVRLQLGNLDGAVADAQQVPEGFTFWAEYSIAAPERYNISYINNWLEEKLTIPPPYQNMEVQGIPDPRVQVLDLAHKGDDNITGAWVPLKYNSLASPIRLASWEEAQLIIAEARLGETAVDRINALRTQHGLPLYQPVDVNDPEESLAQVIEERRREFFLEGQRLADMIRYKGRDFIQWLEGLNRQQGAVFTQQYCFPPPDREIFSNPNVPGDPGDYTVRR